ncbi:flagellar protein FliT [Bacillus songklensis]|uniref:Flagellar protein FliT n=1 Tax=Bacillus songklensis TaxID=1069116 RepID=A0ABV8BB48_9BACI
MSVVLQVYEITKQLYELVTISPSGEERDSYIRRIEELLGQRQRLLPQVKSPFSEEETKLGQEIVQMNQVIDGHLKQRKEEVSVDIRKLKQKQQKTNKYINPYENLSFDGTFYDKRK